MSEYKKWIPTEAKEIIVYLFIGLLFTIILPMFAGFSLGGFQPEIAGGQPFAIALNSYLGGFIIYFFLIIGSLFVIIFPISRLIAGDRKDHPATRKNPNWFTIFTVSLIDSPEENGLLYRAFHYLGFKKNPMRWTMSLLRCTIIAVLLFGGLGILQVSYPQLNVAGVPHTSQQVTPASDIIFGAGVPSFSENGMLMLIFFILLGIDAYLCSKFKWGLGGFFAIAFFICILMGFIWMSYHSIVYSNSDASLLATFIFGFAGSLLTLLTGVFIFWFIWHFMNNLFLKLAKIVLVKEDLIFLAIILWFVLLITYIIIEILIHKYKKKKQERVIIPE